MNYASWVRSVSRILTVALMLVCSNIGFAQVTASMTGRVEDPSGAGVPETNVTVTSLETGSARTVVSDEAGNFRVVSLPVGRYEVRAQKNGFKAALQTGINLVVGEDAVLSLKLEVGSVDEQVTITGEAPVINTTTSSISGLVSEKQVKELPLNGRSFDLLITLNVGTINFTYNKSAANPGVGGNLFSVTGRRSAENVVLLNGVEYTGAGNAAVSPGGASGQLLGIDAVREYNVVSDTYGAEYGKRAGAQVTMVTQSGTNQLHGTLFEFLRNSDLDARDFFAQGGVPPFKRNQFGGAAGGPIRKDKLFIFGNYEGLRQRLAQATLTFVPDANARQGLLPCVSSGVPTCGGALLGTPTPVPNLDTRMLPYLNDLFPSPNGPNLGGGIAESFSTPAAPIRQDFGTLRVDLTSSVKDSFSSSYTIDDGYNLTPGQVPVFGLAVDIRNQVASFQETHVFSPQLVNSFTTGFSRSFYENSETQTIETPASLSYVAGRPPGTIMLGGNLNTSTGLSQPGNQNPFALFVRNLYTATDSFQLIRGRHQFSFGGWFQRTQDNDNDPLRGNGSASFTNMATLLQGTVSTFTVAPKTVQNGWRNWEGAWYAQDTIQLRHNLSLRAGIRHEFASAWTEVNGQAETYLFSQGVIQTVPRISGTFNTANNSRWLFSPRIGLAWDPFGKGTTSIRVGGGIYYDMLDWLLYFVDTTPPLNGAASYSNVSLFSIIPINTATPVLPPCSPGVARKLCNTYLPKSIQSDYKIPTVISWNFSIEQQLAGSTGLRLAYVGSRNYHNWLTGDPNTIPEQTCSDPAGCLAGGINAAHTTVPQGTGYIPVGTRPNSDLGSGFYSFTEGYGNYNSLQVEVTRRLAAGLQFRANYTWSKSLDIASSIFSQIGGTGGGSANYHIKGKLGLDYGLSAFNIAHQAGGNLSYELPFGRGKRFAGNAHGVAGQLITGWQANTIVTILSGFPMTIATGGNPSGNGDTNGTDRPNYAPGFSGDPTSGVTKGCGGVIPAGQRLRTPNRWFDPCDFALPASGTFGNLARGYPIGPGLTMVNASLFKNFRISEKAALQFRTEVFNLLNHPNFRTPQAANPLIFTGSTYSPSAGVIQDTATSSRQIQFGLKLNF
jgi:Carboxypeptidase regulatory-like domain